MLDISAPISKEAASKEVKIQVEGPKVNGGKMPPPRQILEGFD